MGRVSRKCRSSMLRLFELMQPYDLDHFTGQACRMWGKPAAVRTVAGCRVFKTGFCSVWQNILLLFWIQDYPFGAIFSRMIHSPLELAEIFGDLNRIVGDFWHLWLIALGYGTWLIASGGMIWGNSSSWLCCCFPPAHHGWSCFDPLSKWDSYFQTCSPWSLCSFLAQSHTAPVL